MSHGFEDLEVYAIMPVPTRPREHSTEEWALRGRVVQLELENAELKRRARTWKGWAKHFHKTLQQRTAHLERTGNRQMQLDDLLGHLWTWAQQNLKPRPCAWHDTFWDGIRVAKQEVADMIKKGFTS